MEEENDASLSSDVEIPMESMDIANSSVIVKEEQSTTTAFSHIKSKVKSFTKKGQEEPLRMPFELPRNYPQVVMADLEQGKLSGKARAKFISSIASAIFKEKSYPLPSEYDHIGQVITAKYHFLKSSNGSGYVSYM